MVNFTCMDIPDRKRKWIVSLMIFMLIPPLLTGCGEDPDRAIENIYKMQADPTPENLKKLRKALNSSNHDIRATALHVLVHLGVKDGSDLAIRCLGDEEPFVRMTAAGLLGDIKSKAGVEILAERLQEDEDWHVRQKAAEALGAIGGVKAGEYLKAGFTDPIMEVRRASIMAVAKVAPDDAMDGLILLLKEDKDWEVRVQAARALAGLGRPDAIPALKEALYGDGNKFVQAAAAHAIEILNGDGSGSPF